MSSEVTANGVCKDNIFRMLFNNQSKAAELYNAIKGTNYAPDALSMNTIENPLSLGTLLNDVSFTVEDKVIIFFENNSSIDPNIGLNFLLYIAELYESSIGRSQILYKENKIELPEPEFYMIYSGTDQYPEQTTLKLSDLFDAQDGGKHSLKLTIRVYNVNKGYNEDILARSKTLYDYAAFISKVRDDKETGA